jgi:hypothetical protein
MRRRGVCAAMGITRKENSKMSVTLRIPGVRAWKMKLDVQVQYHRAARNDLCILYIYIYVYINIYIYNNLYGNVPFLMTEDDNEEEEEEEEDVAWWYDKR